MPACHILAVDDERDWQFLLEKWYRTPIKAGELVIHYAPDAGAALAQCHQFKEKLLAIVPTENMLCHTMTIS
jgi:hypothetical protein